MAAHLCKRTEYTSWTELRKQITGQWKTLNSYICGACFKNFQTICTLHYHCMRHTKGGSYFFDHKSNTAYPRFDVASRSSQYADDDLTNEKLKVLMGHSKSKNKKNQQHSDNANNNSISKPKHITRNRSVNDSFGNKVENEMTVEETGNIDKEPVVQPNIITMDESYGALKNDKHDKIIEEANCFDADNGSEDKSDSVLDAHHTVDAGHKTDDKAHDGFADHHTIDNVQGALKDHHIVDKAHGVYPDHRTVKDKHDVHSDHPQNVDEAHGNTRFEHGSSKREDHEYCKGKFTGPEGNLKKTNTVLDQKEIKSKKIVPGQCTCYTNKNESKINLVKINEGTLRVTLTEISGDVDQIADNDDGILKAQETRKKEQPDYTHEDTGKYEQKNGKTECSTLIPGGEKSFVPLRSSRRRKVTEKIKESCFANILSNTRQEISLNNDQDIPEDSMCSRTAKKRKTSPIVNDSVKELTDIGTEKMKTSPKVNDSLKELNDIGTDKLKTSPMVYDSVNELADSVREKMKNNPMVNDSIKELADIGTESGSKNTSSIDLKTKIDQLKKKHLSSISPKRKSKAKKNTEKYVSDSGENSITKLKKSPYGDNISNDVQCSGITAGNVDQQNKSIVEETNENHSFASKEMTEESENEFFQIHKRKDFVCQVCGKMGTIGFVNHHKQLHSACSEGTYDCELCGKSFKNAATKSVHKRIHGTKKYKCDSCPAAFHRRLHLETHLNKHDGIKPYMCDHCGERYRHFSTLRQHIIKCRGDKNFSCDICGKKFYQKAPKDRHRKCHFAPDLLCSKCPKMCQTQTDLKRHELTHTGEKRFFCSLCYIGCSQNHAYYRHMRNIHNIGKIQAKELMIRNKVNVNSKHGNVSYYVNINGQSLNAVATKKNRRKTVLSLTADPLDLVSAEQKESEVQTDLLVNSNDNIRNSGTDTVNSAEIDYLTNHCVVTDTTEETPDVADAIVIYESGEANDIQSFDNQSRYFVLNDFLPDGNIVINSDGTSCSVGQD